MNIPIPNTINFNKPTFQPIEIGDIQTLNINEFTDAIQINDPLQPLPEELNKFYVLLYQNIISNSLNDFFRNLSVVRDKLTNLGMLGNADFKREATLKAREISRKLRQMLNSIGTFTNGAISGLMINNINDLHAEELVARREIALKYTEQNRKLFTDIFLKLANQLTKGNEVYSDIFTKDIQLTYKAHQDWLDYVISYYNIEMERVKLESMKRKLNLQAAIENIKQFKYKDLINKEKLVVAGLSNDIKEQLNLYEITRAEYLTGLEKFYYLQYEQLGYEVEIAKSNLQKFETELRKIDYIAKFINANTDLYLQKLDIEEQKLKSVNYKFDVAEQQLRARDIELQVKNEELAAKYAEIKAKLQDNDIALANLKSKLYKYEASLLNSIKQVDIDVSKSIMKVLKERKTTLKYLQTELQAKNMLYKFDNEVRTKLSIEEERIKSSISAYERTYGIQVPSQADWYRTCAISHAQITAAFIRSYA